MRMPKDVKISCIVTIRSREVNYYTNIEHFEIHLAKCIKRYVGLLRLKTVPKEGTEEVEKLTGFIGIFLKRNWIIPGKYGERKTV